MFSESNDLYYVLLFFFSFTFLRNCSVEIFNSELERNENGWDRESILHLSPNDIKCFNLLRAICSNGVLKRSIKMMCNYDICFSN